MIVAVFCSSQLVNGQERWEQVVDNSLSDIFGFCVDMHGRYLACGSDGIFYRSTDGGRTWPALQSTINVGSAYRVCVYAVDLDSAGDIFATVVQFERYPSDPLHQKSESAQFESTDLGETWTQICPWNGEFRTPLSGDNGNSFQIRDSGLYHTTNGGSSWSNMLAVSIGQVLLDPRDSQLVVSSGSRIYFSRDLGNHWKTIDSGYSGGNVFCLLQIKKAELIVGSLYGAWHTTDDGQSWTQLSLGDAAIYSLACNSLGIIYASTYDGVLRSTDGGATWDSCNNGLTKFSYYSLKLDSIGNLYVLAHDFGIFRTVESTSKIDEQKSIEITHPQLAFDPAFPIPSHTQTTFSFSTQNSVTCRMVVLNVLGCEVETLLSGELVKGRREVELNTKEYPAGSYYCQLTVPGQRAQQHFVVTK